MKAVPANSASEKGQKPNLVLLPPLQLQLSPIFVGCWCERGVGEDVVLRVRVASGTRVACTYGTYLLWSWESDSNKQSMHYQ